MLFCSRSDRTLPDLDTAAANAGPQDQTFLLLSRPDPVDFFEIPEFERILGFVSPVFLCLSDYQTHGFSPFLCPDCPC